MTNSLTNQAKISYMNDECKWWMRFSDQCRFPFAMRALLGRNPVYAGISHPTKHVHSNRSLHAVIQFIAFAVTFIFRRMASLLFCARFVVAFAFDTCILWKLSLMSKTAMSWKCAGTTWLDEQITYYPPVSWSGVVAQQAGEACSFPWNYTLWEMFRVARIKFTKRWLTKHRG